MAGASRVFLDTSALFAGIWSREGGARMLLKLCEAGALELLIDSTVLAEIERTVREKAPDVLSLLAMLLDRSGVSVAPAPGRRMLRSARQLVAHPRDARVLAAAWGAGCESFVTLDRKHFLDNSGLRTAVPFQVGTPGDCLAWFRARLMGRL